jgi:hypothetical protein
VADDPETCKFADAGLSHLPSFAGFPGRAALLPGLRGYRESPAKADPAGSEPAQDSHRRAMADLNRMLAATR